MLWNWFEQRFYGRSCERTRCRQERRYLDCEIGVPYRLRHGTGFEVVTEPLSILELSPWVRPLRTKVLQAGNCHLDRSPGDHGSLGTRDPHEVVDERLSLLEHS